MRGSNYFIQASTPPGELVDLDKQVYRKEVVYPGHFMKMDSDDTVEYDLTVDDSLLDHWANQFKKMKQAGIEVPLPIEHTTDPEKRRGTVVDLKKEYSPDREANALFAYIKFRDPETAAALAKTSQVSLYSPPDFIDGKGVKYKRPIRHIAITDYPVIPDLRGWETVTASLVLSENGVQSMAVTLKDALDRLGVSYPDGADDETMLGVLEEAWNASDEDEFLEEEGLSDEELLEEEGLSDEELLEEEGLSDDELLEEEGLSDEELLEKEEIAASHGRRRTRGKRRGIAASSVVSALSSARTSRLEGLVQSGKMTPAQRVKIEKQFATKRAVAHAMSHGSLRDGFDTVVASFDMMTSRFRGERTPAQHGDSGKSPLIVDAEKRAARKK